MTTRESISKISNNVNEAARDIWLAGLGAFSRAQEEGNKVFESLVKDGQDLEDKTRKDVTDRVKSFRGQVESRVDSVKQKYSGQLSKLEKVFEDRVAFVLGRLGVPSSDDIQTLAKRVQALSKEVKALNEETKDKKAA